METLAGLGILVAVVAIIAVFLSGGDNDAAGGQVTPTPSAVPTTTVAPTPVVTPEPSTTAVSPTPHDPEPPDVALPVGSARVGPPMISLDELAFGSGWLVYDGEQGPTAVDLASGERRVIASARAQQVLDQDDVVFTAAGVWRINSLRSRLDRWDGGPSTVLANDDLAPDGLQQLRQPDGHRIRLHPEVGPIVYRLLEVGSTNDSTRRLVAHALSLDVVRRVELEPEIARRLSGLDDLLTTPTGPAHPTLDLGGRTWEWDWNEGWDTNDLETVMRFENGTIARGCSDPSSCTMFLVPDGPTAVRALDRSAAQLVMALADVRVLEALVGVTNTSLVSYRAPTLAPDRQQMVTLSARDEFVLIDLDTGAQESRRIRRPGPGLYTSMLWSDDSTGVLVVGRDQTSAVDTETLEVTLVSLDLAEVPRARAQIFASIEGPAGTQAAPDTTD